MGIKTALLWFFFIIFVTVTWRLLDLPAEEDLKLIVTGWLASYGLLIVFFGSLFETILFVGFYFPGSLIIFLSVALAPDAHAAVTALMFVTMGMSLGYVLNYFLGKYGWYRLFLKLGMRAGIENAQVKMQKNDVRYVFLTFWNPGLAAFTSTAAGIIQMKFSRFILLAAPALIFWNIFWGSLVYMLGEKALLFIDFRVILLMVFAWIAFEIWVITKRRGTSAGLSEVGAEKNENNAL